ncbi:hemerythrin [bacterium DOLJORAL78_65_58]|nr:MAG: hemerythrin [bacterium DOLJORAL78_65_58]
MAFIDWTEDFVTGVESVDNHRQLVDIVNKFEEAAKRGKGSRIMGEILNDLIGYTAEHFSHEEKVMEELGYPKLKMHQSQHRQLLQRVERLQFEFHQKHRRITPDVREFLKYWLTNHILKDDKAWAALVTQKV